MREELYIPVSALNAFVYCPRKFYYQYILFEHEDNYHTVLGNIVHEKIDVEAHYKEKEKYKWSSVSLKSELWGLTGKLDIMEMS